MIKMNRKLLCVTFYLALLIIFVLGTSPAHARLSRQTASAVWERISQAAGLRPTPLQLDPSNQINAWVKFQSRTNYQVFVTQGLLNILEHPGELAGVLGHEAAHITQGHYTATVGRNLGIGLLASLLDNSGNRLLRTVGTGGLLLAHAGFSREQEVEADDVGAIISQRAGFGAWGLHNAMVRMRQHGVVTQRSGFNSHPPTDRRLERMARHATELRANEERQIREIARGQQQQRLNEQQRLNAESTQTTGNVRRAIRQTPESPAPSQTESESIDARFQALVERMLANNQ